MCPATRQSGPAGATPPIPQSICSRSIPPPLQRIDAASDERSHPNTLPVELNKILGCKSIVRRIAVGLDCLASKRTAMYTDYEKNGFDDAAQ